MEIKTFLKENEPKKFNKRDLSDWFDDPQFISGLAYLADVFGVLNVLNKSMQWQSLKPGKRWNHVKANLCYGRGDRKMAM